MYPTNLSIYIYFRRYTISSKAGASLTAALSRRMSVSVPSSDPKVKSLSDVLVDCEVSLPACLSVCLSVCSSLSLSVSLSALLSLSPSLVLVFSLSMSLPLPPPLLLSDPFSLTVPLFQLLAQFVHFCALEMSEELVLFTIEADAYRIHSEYNPSDRRGKQELATVLFTRFCADDAPLNIGMCDEARSTLKKDIESTCLTGKEFDEVADEVFKRMNEDQYVRFINSSTFRSTLETI